MQGTFWKDFCWPPRPPPTSVHRAASSPAYSLLLFLDPPGIFLSQFLIICYFLCPEPCSSDLLMPRTPSLHLGLQLRVASSKRSIQWDLGQNPFCNGSFIWQCHRKWKRGEWYQYGIILMLLKPEQNRTWADVQVNSLSYCQIKYEAGTDHSALLLASWAIQSIEKDAIKCLRETTWEKRLQLCWDISNQYIWTSFCKSYYGMQTHWY